MKTILLPPAAVAATPRGNAALRAGRLRRLLQALMNQLCYIYSRSFRTYPDILRSDNISRPSFAMKTILLPPAAVAATPRGNAALRAGRLRRLLQALMNQLCYIYSRSFRTYPDILRSDNISRPSFAMNACNASIHSLVLSPGNYPQDNFLPPEGAWAFPLRYNVHAHVIVSSPGFSLWLNPAPRGGDLP